MLLVNQRVCLSPCKLVFSTILQWNIIGNKPPCKNSSVPASLVFLFAVLRDSRYLAFLTCFSSRCLSHNMIDLEEDIDNPCREMNSDRRGL